MTVIHSLIRVAEGIFDQAKEAQGDGGLRLDVPSEEVCQHWNLARRWREQASSQAEEVAWAVPKGMSTA